MDQSYSNIKALISFETVCLHIKIKLFLDLDSLPDL